MPPFNGRQIQQQLRAFLVFIQLQIDGLAAKGDKCILVLFEKKRFKGLNRYSIIYKILLPVQLLLPILTNDRQYF